MLFCSLTSESSFININHNLIILSASVCVCLSSFVCLRIRIADKAFYKQPNSDVIGFVYVSRHILVNFCQGQISQVTSSFCPAFIKYTLKDSRKATAFSFLFIAKVI